MFKNLNKRSPRHSPLGICMELSGLHSLQNPWSGLQRTWTRYFWPGYKLRTLNWVCCPAKCVWGGKRETEVTCLVWWRDFSPRYKLLGSEWTVKFSGFPVLPILLSPLLFLLLNIAHTKINRLSVCPFGVHFRKINKLPSTPAPLLNSTFRNTASQ